ncbi:MAG: hypothetical protein DKM50_01975 [Candidatus Margulisiibacteriota bacterium]|nr:MAG: hypothetical protein A2X43_13170 [Candidatus Margulisbacteria bacterium GWD2_39_127]OGI04792.1 MAG: hypothetical protein A2X42_10825 [Candidatus Margulisbacteria bacterium GWF2_38_17]OGI05737.1 MAG: hypothetical protein A2X41_03410 [Candidatus Margulisbacteria bacterium GWE2_39_32]PZM83671.1 MAG: hypothetical protein DKM50_01975 [Candidatus Margulisiibacteriota bacterium]HAR62089.1 hypothetical protein [Candidatus Margulisiibacteriota bacterium]
MGNNRIYCRIIFSLLILIGVTAPLHADDQGLFTLRFNWPAKLSGHVISEVGFHRYEAGKEKSHYAKKANYFSITKINDGFEMITTGGMVLQNIPLPNVKDRLHLLAEIDTDPTIVLSKKGEVAKIIGLEEYRTNMLNLVKERHSEYDKKELKAVSSYYDAKDLEANLINDYDETFFYMLKYWIDKSFTPKSVYSGVSMIRLPTISTSDVKYHGIAQVRDLNKKNSLVILEFKEFVDPGDLKQMLIENNIITLDQWHSHRCKIDPRKLYNKFEIGQSSNADKSDNSYRYTTTHFLVTDFNTLVPLQYIKSVEIVLPDFEQYEVVKYSYIND